jgi:hypothetical protein
MLTLETVCIFKVSGVKDGAQCSRTRLACARPGIDPRKTEKRKIPLGGRVGRVT